MFGYWEELLLVVDETYQNGHVTAPTPTMEAGRHLCSPELGGYQAAVAVLAPALRLRRPNAVVGADCMQANSSLEACWLCQAPEANMGELSYVSILDLN